MNNILKITFAVLLTFIIPSGSALALGSGYNDPIQVQLVTPFGSDPNQSVVNGLNDINNSIKANTKAAQDVQTKQQWAALNPECVAQMTAYIKAHDVYLNQTDKMISDYIAQNSNNNNPQDRVAYVDHLNYLYTLRAAQNQSYIDYTISACSSSTLNAACIKSSGPNAEMKSYNATTGAIECKCASGYVWSSSACVAQQAQQASTPKTTPAVTTNQVPAAATEPPAKQPAASVSRPTTAPQVVHKTIATPATAVSSTTGNNSTAKKDTEATTTPTYHKGLVQNVWSWFTGLFGF